ncbi:carboxypeptidase-like regulatory domain-containing protein [Larkinella terrae]|uniref:Carboxypeptidase regulatory-like domain-containing protein n=1 Tax=Larkinella terrae TaxID=2025311 RepID=A0A7K0EKI8_9BACT|nr:carboxypeptidase-like regulatory domain-containing protein [Larkinella terrae]MRS62327.1 hypothetical protein [Larkinella terrae]
MNAKLLFIAALLFVGCSKDPSAIEGGKADWGIQPALPVVNGEATFNLNAADDYVSVMGNSVPRMPNFPKLSARSGVVRGYVADLSGNPLEGAYIGVRSTATGGSYSGASDETDVNGYYEITVPWGAAEFYAAGYTIDYGEGRAVVSLGAADGKLGSFASAEGLVKNFVLLSYGVFNKDLVSQKPRDPTNYAGGCFYITYNVADASSVYNPETYIPENAEIQVTLTPDEPGLFGENKKFVINKKASLQNYNFIVMNVPIGRYTLTAKLNGKPLRMEAVGRYANLYPYFGLKPGTATGSAKLLFTPDTQSGNSLTLPNRGNWGSLQIKVERAE